MMHVRSECVSASAGMTGARGPWPADCCLSTDSLVICFSSGRKASSPHRNCAWGVRYSILTVRVGAPVKVAPVATVIIHWSCYQMMI